MSGLGFNAALSYGKDLKSFKSKEKAEKYFLSYKDKLLAELEKACCKYHFFVCDYSVESLKNIEKIYFNLYESKGFEKIGFSRKTFESLMSVYFGEVVIRNNEDAKYEVREFPFLKGKYELYVNKGLLYLSVLDKYTYLYERPNNKKRNSVFREYNKYFK